VKQERTKPSFTLLGPLHQIPIQNDLVKKALGQVLCLLVAITLMTQIAVNWLPVSIEQQTNQVPISFLV
jgi:hypothetical protein